MLPRNDVKEALADLSWAIKQPEWLQWNIANSVDTILDKNNKESIYEILKSLKMEVDFAIDNVLTDEEISSIGIRLDGDLVTIRDLNPIHEARSLIYSLLDDSASIFISFIGNTYADETFKDHNAIFFKLVRDATTSEKAEFLDTLRHNVARDSGNQMAAANSALESVIGFGESIDKLDKLYKVLAKIDV